MANSGFVLSEKLSQEKVLLGSWDLCEVLLMDDANYPGWLVLVPRKANLVELDDLASHDQVTLMAEISRASKAIREVFRPFKLNVGALGNIVSQLHIHIIPRNKEDAAWPGPAWGAVPTKPFSVEDLASVGSKLQSSAAFSDSLPLGAKNVNVKIESASSNFSINL